jgi:3-oxoacyl-[acyl-carrier-protein] synthase II
MIYLEKKRRVVITGLGAVSSVGIGVKDFWTSLKNGNSGCSLIKSFDTTNLKVKIAAEIHNFIPSNYFSEKEIIQMDRFSQFAVIASSEAILDSGLIFNDSNNHRTGIIMGIAGFGVITTQNACKRIDNGENLDRWTVASALPNAAAGIISIKNKIYGPNWCITAGCAAATQAIGEGFEYIKNGKYDIMIVGGSEAPITNLNINGLGAAGVLSLDSDPKKAMKPFDENRDGFVLGEGAGILILESLDHAVARGAKIYAEIVGFGLSSDGINLVSPARDGKEKIFAIKQAIDEAGISHLDIQYINAHATATKVGDEIEARVIREYFNGNNDLLVSATKSMIGHTQGASGGLETIATIMSIFEGVVHPTINLNSLSDCFGLDFVPNTLKKKDINYAMKNSFGFGGTNICLILKKY